MTLAPGSSLALYGRDHVKAGEYALHALVSPGQGGAHAGGAGTALGLSAGSPVAVGRKGKEDSPNEDCVYAFDDGRRAIHVIADAHYGEAASRVMVEALAAVFDGGAVAADPYESIQCVAEYWRSHCVRGGAEPDASSSTLLVVNIDREAGTVRGVNIGDSGFFVGKPETRLRQATEPRGVYAAPWLPDSFFLPPCDRFELAVKPGDWVISTSDGVTECSYRRPQESIGAVDIEALLSRVGTDPESAARGLMELSLTGVRGNTGGEDNVALAVTRV